MEPLSRVVCFLRARRSVLAVLYPLTLMRYPQQCGQMVGGQDGELRWAGLSWVMVTRLHLRLINLLSAFRHLRNIPLSDTCSAARHPLVTRCCCRHVIRSRDWWRHAADSGHDGTLELPSLVVRPMYAQAQHWAGHSTQYRPRPQQQQQSYLLRCSYHLCAYFWISIIDGPLESPMTMRFIFTVLFTYKLLQLIKK